MEASEPSASGARARERSATRARASITRNTFLFHEQIEFSFRLWRDSNRFFFFYDRCDDKVPSRLLADWPFVVCCCFLTDDRRIRGRAWPRRIECWSAGRFNPRLRTSPWPLSASSTPRPIHGARAHKRASQMCRLSARYAVFRNMSKDRAALFFSRVNERCADRRY